MEIINTAKVIAERPVGNKEFIDLPVHIRPISTWKAPADTHLNETRPSQYIRRNRYGFNLGLADVGQFARRFIGACVYALWEYTFHTQGLAFVKNIISYTQRVCFHNPIKTVEA